MTYIYNHTYHDFYLPYEKLLKYLHQDPESNKVNSLESHHQDPESNKVNSLESHHQDPESNKVDSLESLHQKIYYTCVLPDRWYFSSTDKLVCFQVTHQSACLPPLAISKILVVKAASNPVLKEFSARLTSATFYQSIHAIHYSNICVGNYDKQCIEVAHSKKRLFYATYKQLLAVLEESFCFVVKEVERCSTIRHVNCDMLLVKIRPFALFV